MCESFFETLCLDSIDTVHVGWGIFLEACIFLYAFAGLAIVCDEYLVVSLETLCVRFNIREVSDARASQQRRASLSRCTRASGSARADLSAPPPQDIAGASFMAFGSAAPEIIINAVATIQAATSKNTDSAATNLGVSAIIG